MLIYKNWRPASRLPNRSDCRKSAGVRYLASIAGSRLFRPAPRVRRRLPLGHELTSLVDPALLSALSSPTPALPAGHPFIGVVGSNGSVANGYWMNGFTPINSTQQFVFFFDQGFYNSLMFGNQYSNARTWCVRDSSSQNPIAL